MTITVEIKNIDEIMRVVQQAPFKMTRNLSIAIERIIGKIESGAKREAPVNKQSGGGNLRQSISGQMTGGLSGRVDVKASYGIFVHEGTRSHPISIRYKKVLANKRMGQFFGKIIDHPGTKANPFLQRAVDKNTKFIDQEFIKAVENSLK